MLIAPHRADSEIAKKGARTATGATRAEKRVFKGYGEEKSQQQRGRRKDQLSEKPNRTLAESSRKPSNWGRVTALLRTERIVRNREQKRDFLMPTQPELLRRSVSGEEELHSSCSIGAQVP